MRAAGAEPLPTIMADGKSDEKVSWKGESISGYSIFSLPQRWEEASQSQIKKFKKIWVRESHKNTAKEEKEVGGVVAKCCIV